MRLIRGSTGRGLGHYYLERSDKFSYQKEDEFIRMTYSTIVDHFDQDPVFFRGDRESIFQGYSNIAHSERSSSRVSNVYGTFGTITGRGEFSQRHQYRNNTIGIILFSNF